MLVSVPSLANRNFPFTAMNAALPGNGEPVRGDNVPLASAVNAKICEFALLDTYTYATAELGGVGGGVGVGVGEVAEFTIMLTLAVALLYRLVSFGVNVTESVC